MARTYTTDALVAALKRRAAIPISQQTFTEDDLVDYLNDEMESTIVPIIMDYREEFFLEHVDYDIASNTAAVFDIPTNAVGQRLRDVNLVSIASNGEESLSNLPLLALEQVSSSGRSGSFVSGLYGFRIVSNSVHLYPTHGWGQETLRLHYYGRPNELVLENQAGKITAIDYNTNVVTVNNVLVEWIPGFVVDVIKGKQPFNTICPDQDIIAISGYNITFTDVSHLEHGDYVCNNGESVFPQIPTEGHNLLLQAAKIVILESIDDTDNIKIAKEKYTQMETNFIKAVTPRVDGQAKKIVSNNNVFQRGTSSWL